MAGQRKDHIRRQRAIENVDEHLAVILRWDGKTEAELGVDEDFKLAHEEFEKVVLSAARAGFDDNPTVGEYLAVHSALGHRDLLRRSKSGYEKGVHWPWTPSEFKTWKAISEYCNAFKKRKGRYPKPELTRKALANSGDLKKVSRQAFHKLIDRLELRQYFDLD